jgi:hypothetical protein
MIEKNLQGLWFWGYLHSNGTVQVKRWFGDHDDYTRDCEGNEFVKKVVMPFTADNFDEAKEYITKKLRWE